MNSVVRGLPTAEMGVVDMYSLHPETFQQGTYGLVIVSGDLDSFKDSEVPIPTRIQSTCAPGELGTSLDCDCNAQLAAARAALNGFGMLVILGQEGRGAGLEAKLEAMAFQQQQGVDTATAYAALGLPWDQRDYSHAVDFMVEHGVRDIELATNNPLKKRAFDGRVRATRRRHVAGVRHTNIDYLLVKAGMGHLLDRDELEAELEAI